jgi:tetratricopeptide (TPR) repeat protein
MSMRRAAIACALAAGLSSGGAAARAQPELEDTPAREHDFSWDAGDKEELTEYDKLMARGDTLALRAARMRAIEHYGIRELAAHAIMAYEMAAKAAPAEAEPHYRAAQVIHAHFLYERTAPSHADARRAIHHWEEFERLAPLDPRSRAILFTRSITYTKLGTRADLSRALADYERLLELSDLTGVLQGDAALYLGNMAEVYMMMDRLEEAIATYERALRIETSVSHALGLAVALDRHGQGAKAREVASQYLSETGFRGYKSQIKEGAIFYVPYGEKYYYLALGNEVLGRRQEALEHYRAFITSGAHPQFQARARENIADLDKQLGKESGKHKRRKRRSRPR